jgi:hypothetical protein
MTDVRDAKMIASRMQKSPVTIAAMPYSENGPHFHTGTKPSE